MRGGAGVLWQGQRCGAPSRDRTMPQCGAPDSQCEHGPGPVRGRRTRCNFSDVMGHKDHGLSGHEAWECKEGGDARHARRRSGREGPKPLTLRALVSSAPVLRGRASNSPIEESSQISASSLRRRYIRISGRELHICASRPTRDASASKCSAMLKGLGHERGAHQGWSAHSGAAFDRDVQVVRHRALRGQSRLAPDDDADACAPAWSEAGRRSNGASVAPGVGKRWGQAALTCLSIDTGLWRPI